MNQEETNCRKIDLKPSNGFFDLCVNISSKDEETHLREILLRLYQSKLFIVLFIVVYSILILYLEKGKIKVSINNLYSFDEFVK